MRLHVVLLKHTAVRKFDRQIERSLSAHSGEDGESLAGRTLTLDPNDLFQVLAGERFDVSAVGKLRVGHDGSRIGVGQHHFESLGLERLAGLRSGVVKLRRLAMMMGPEPMDQDLRDVCSSRHLALSAHLHGLGDVA